MSAAAPIALGPLAAALLILAARRWVVPLALLGAAVSLAFAAVTLARVADGARFAATLPGLPGLPLRLTITPLAALLATTVAVVNALVTVYAVGYMRDERDPARFFAEMAFFAAAMQLLVLAGDWLLFLAAWELIALASYLLIAFWFARPEAGAAATRAFLTTRATDVGLYVGIFVLVDRTGTTAIPATLRVHGAAAVAAGLLLLLAAMGKAAQVPFQGWLQDAMVAPTPVSALLHAATLVVAGVILLLRVSPLLPPGVLLAAGLAGGVTAVVAGLTAVAERDLKRLLAASTSSQLGLMFVGLGAASIGAAVAHLVTNAAMKSALFLGAGIFQRARHATAFADLRGIGRRRRLTFAALAVAGLALAGVPPLAGFWSKDAIVAAALAARHPWPLAALALGGALLSAIYVARMLRLLWHDPADDAVHAEAVAGLAWMGAGLAGLILLAAVLGAAISPISRLLGVAVPERTAAITLGLAVAAIGLLLGWLVPAARLLGALRPVAARGFRIGDGWRTFAVRPALALAHAGDRLDGAIHERVVLGAGHAGLAIARAARLSDEGIARLVADVASAAWRLGGRARRLQSGLVFRELLVAAAGAAIIVALLILLAER